MSDSGLPLYDQPEDIASLRQWDRSVLWHAFSQMSEYESLLIERGDGCWLYDVEGQRLLDGVSSLWCNVHGHRHPVIDQAIRDQLDQIAHVTLLGMSHPTTVKLAKRLVEIAPHGLEHVFFSSDGSSALEVALKLAFQYWRQCESPEPNRKLFLALGQAYHGDTLGSVSVGGVSRFHAMFDPLLFSVLRGPTPDRYRLPARATIENAAEHYLASYRRILEDHAGEVVAIIAEPLVQGAAGMVMHPRGFLKGLRELASEFNVLLIVDEVASGMGRTGTMWACQQEGVEPDILCTGKGLTGGYLPMAATLTSTQIWNAFLGLYEQSRSFFHGHTYGGNPLAAAAAFATIDLFDKEKTLERLPEKSLRLAAGLESLKEHPNVGDVRQIGLIAAVELVSDKKAKLAYPWAERRGLIACQRAIQEGVWLRPIGSTIIVMPPLSIDHEQIDLLCHAVRCGVEAATRLRT